MYCAGANIEEECSYPLREQITVEKELNDPGIYWQKGMMVLLSPRWQARQSSFNVWLVKSPYQVRGPRRASWKSPTMRRFSKAVRFTQVNVNRDWMQNLRLFTNGSLVWPGTCCPRLWRRCTTSHLMN